MMKRMLMTVVFFVTFAAAGQQRTPCNPEQRTDCTVGQAVDFYRTNPAAATIAQEVVDTNKPTTTPDPFAGRVHNSYEDFLNLFSFAIDQVEESDDGQALVVRFNPLREGPVVIGGTLTVAEPQISDVVKNAIPEAIRETTVSALEKQLSDTDDTTFAVSASFNTVRCSLVVTDDQNMCFGRSPSTYRDILAYLLVRNTPPLDAAKELEIGQAIVALYPADARPQGSVFDWPISGARDNAAAVRAKAKELVAAEAAGRASTKAFFADRHLDLLPSLLDNQPQISAIGSFHRPGDLGGPKERSLTFELHWGRNNINTMRKACTGMVGVANISSCLQRQLDAFATNGMATDKFVVTASYNVLRDYELGSLAIGDTPVAGFTPIDVDGSSRLNVKAQAGRQLGTAVGDEPMRADFSFEYVRTIEHSALTENRMVGTLTLSVPVGNNITIPVSLRYANKGEFIGEEFDRLGAHFGLSYRLPKLFGN